MDWDKSRVKLDRYMNICNITSKLRGDKDSATNAIVDLIIIIRGNPEAGVETLKLQKTKVSGFRDQGQSSNNDDLEIYNRE